jgi:hypothetical protein
MPPDGRAKGCPNVEENSVSLEVGAYKPPVGHINGCPNVEYCFVAR